MTYQLKSLTAAAAMLAGTTLHAAPPQVVTDIAPVHGLVADVMGTLGAPKMLVQPGTSPHGYSMRPSEAAALEQADIVIWIGERLAPWLEEATEALAPNAVSLELLHLPGTTVHEFREGAIFEEHDHEDHAEEKADEHEEHAHEDHAEEKEHAHDEHGHEDHAREGIDPHVWLDPVNGQLWLDVIATALSDADPENAAVYRANADAAREKLDQLIHRLEDDLAPARGKPFVVFHDAYHAFEARFDIEAAGALRASDATDPGAARVAEVRKLIEHENIACVFTEPQFPDRKVTALLEGTSAKIGKLDPLGRDLPTGIGFYPALIESIGLGLIDCLAAE